MPAPSCSHTKQPVKCRLNVAESELVEVAMTTMSQQEEEDTHQSGMYGCQGCYRVVMISKRIH